MSESDEPVSNPSLSGEEGAESDGFNFTFTDYVSGFMLDPLASGDVDEVAPSRNWDSSTTEVDWIEENLFGGNVFVFVWKGFEDKAIKVKERVSAVRHTPLVQKANSYFDQHREYLETYRPPSETAVNTHLMVYSMGVRHLLKAINPEREEISLCPGWKLRTEDIESFAKERFTATVPHRFGCTPDIVLTDEVDMLKAETLVFPIASMETKGPRHAITTLELHQSAHFSHGFDDKGLEEDAEFARFFQAYLNGGPDWNGVGLVHAQAVVQAMLSYTGYTVLYCTTWARAMFVESYQRGDNRAVRVRVSRAFKCDERISATLCVTTTFNEALSLIEGRLADRRRRNMSLLMERAKCCSIISAGTITESFNPLQQLQGTDGGRDGGGSASGARRVAEVRRFGVKWPFSWVEEVPKLVKSGVLPMFRGTGVEMNGELLTPLLNYIMEVDDDICICHAYERSAGIIGEGGSGLVKPTSVNGVSAVIKFWNGNDIKHRTLIINEMAIYAYLAGRFPSVLGTALPKLIAVGTHPSVGASLVMERVGERLTVLDKRVFVGSREVSIQDFMEIKTAALKSLSMLHGASITHGDIALRNILVAQLQDEENRDCNKVNRTQSGWHARFIDLGLSRLQVDKSKLASEWELCNALFRHCIARTNHNNTSFKQRRGKLVSTEGIALLDAK